MWDTWGRRAANDGRAISLSLRSNEKAKKGDSQEKKHPAADSQRRASGWLNDVPILPPTHYGWRRRSG